MVVAKEQVRSEGQGEAMPGGTRKPWDKKKEVSVRICGRRTWEKMKKEKTPYQRWSREKCKKGKCFGKYWVQKGKMEKKQDSGKGGAYAGIGDIWEKFVHGSEGKNLGNCCGEGGGFKERRGEEEKQLDDRCWNGGGGKVGGGPGRGA